jgi:predicted membrane protein
MRLGTSSRRSGTWSGGSLLPFCCLFLLPLIVVAFTVFFLGYAAGLLAQRLWLMACLGWHTLRDRHVADTSSQATTYS